MATNKSLKATNKKMRVKAGVNILKNTMGKLSKNATFKDFKKAEKKSNKQLKTSRAIMKEALKRAIKRNKAK